MKADFHQKTAQIIAFPGRFRKESSDSGLISKFSAEKISTQVCASALDSAWYHDEAVRADQIRPN